LKWLSKQDINERRLAEFKKQFEELEAAFHVYNRVTDAKLERLRWQIKTLQHALGIDIDLTRKEGSKMLPMRLIFQVSVSNGAWLELMTQTSMRQTLAQQAHDAFLAKLETWVEEYLAEQEKNDRAEAEQPTQDKKWEPRGTIY
jgi:hypothetical protein